MQDTVNNLAPVRRNLGTSPNLHDSLIGASFLMSESKHTAGKWEVIQHNPMASLHVISNGVPICQVDHWGKRESDLTANLKPEGEPKANAALIAAAPDLLKALQACVELLDAETLGGAPLDQARAAIAKAKGAQ